MSDTAAVKTLRELFEGIRDESRMYANSATRIGNAFLSLLSYLVDETPYLRKDVEDGTNFLLRLFAGCIIGNNKIVLDADGTISSDSIKNMGNFVDGLFGEGYALWQDAEKNTHMTIDHLTVRQRMVIKELIIDKLRSIGGQLIVSAANGKIKSVVRGEYDYTISFENGNQFRAHDLMRCAQFTGDDIRDYWVEIASASADSVVIPVSEFPTGIVPKVGDECVLMGNTADAARQNIILISASEDGQPRLDVMNNVSSKDFADTLRVRLGCLDGVHDDAFAADKQPNGYGLYADNVWLKGNFILANGEDVQTRFEITDGKITSAIESVTHDISYPDNILDNPDFAKWMTKWETSNDAQFFLLGSKWIWANDMAVADRGSFSRVEVDGSRKVVHIHDNYIKQLNSDFLAKPQFEIDPTTSQAKAIPIHLSFFYHCTAPGGLLIQFRKPSTIVLPTFLVNEDVAANDNYEQFTYDGLWDGEGDFEIKFTGDIKISMLSLTADKADGLKYKYRTLFEQSDRLVRLSAGIYDKNEECLRESGVVIKPEGSGIYAQDEKGNMALIGTAVTKEGKTVIYLTAQNIQLEGLVTANGNFKIDEQGNAEAWNMKLHGYLHNRFLPIEQSDATPVGEGTYLLNTNLFVDASLNTVYLPMSESYEGARVIIMDTPHPLSRLGILTTISTIDGSPLISGVFATTLEDDVCEAKNVKVECGTIELVMMRYRYRNAEGQVTSTAFRWVMVNSACKKLWWTDPQGNERQLNQYIDRITLNQK